MVSTHVFPTFTQLGQLHKPSSHGGSGGGSTVGIPSLIPKHSNVPLLQIALKPVEVHFAHKPSATNKSNPLQSTQSPQKGTSLFAINVSGLKQNKVPSRSQNGLNPFVAHKPVRPGVTDRLNPPIPSGTHEISQMSPLDELEELDPPDELLEEDEPPEELLEELVVGEHPLYSRIVLTAELLEPPNTSAVFVLVN